MAERQDFDEAVRDLGRAIRAEVEPPLDRILTGMDRVLRRWPWLYRRLGGTP